MLTHARAPASTRSLYRALGDRIAEIRWRHGFVLHVGPRVAKRILGGEPGAGEGNDWWARWPVFREHRDELYFEKETGDGDDLLYGNEGRKTTRVIVTIHDHKNVIWLEQIFGELKTESYYIVKKNCSNLIK